MRHVACPSGYSWHGFGDTRFGKDGPCIVLAQAVEGTRQITCFRSERQDARSSPASPPPARIASHSPTSSAAVANVSADAYECRTTALVAPIREGPDGNAEVLADLRRVHKNTEALSVGGGHLGAYCHSRCTSSWVTGDCGEVPIPRDLGGTGTKVLVPHVIHDRHRDGEWIGRAADSNSIASDRRVIASATSDGSGPRTLASGYSGSFVSSDAPTEVR